MVKKDNNVEENFVVFFFANQKSKWMKNIFTETSESLRYE